MAGAGGLGSRVGDRGAAGGGAPTVTITFPCAGDRGRPDFKAPSAGFGHIMVVASEGEAPAVAEGEDAAAGAGETVEAGLGAPGAPAFAGEDENDGAGEGSDADGIQNAV